MIAVSVGAGYTVNYLHCRLIDDNGEIIALRPRIQRAHIARFETVLLQKFRIRRFNIITADKVLNGHVIDLMVAADHRQNEFTVDIESNGFNRLFHRRARNFDEILNGRAFRRCKELHFFRLFRFRDKGFGDRLFHIGCKTAFRTNDDIRFARFCEGHEFMAVVTADLAGIGQYGTAVKAASFKNTAIRIVHDIVAGDHTVFVGVKRIGVFHDKLTAAH